MTTLIPSNKTHETLLVIESNPENLNFINNFLNHDYHIKSTDSGEKGLHLATVKPYPALILLDMLLSDRDGHTVCRQLKTQAATRDIPVILFSAVHNEAEEEAGFMLGAIDYISQPISGPILRARVKAHLGTKQTADFIRDKNVFLVGEVTKRAKELEFIQDVTILALASLAETRDNETGNHIRRTQRYVQALAERLKHHPRFSLLLTRTNIELIHKSAPLHDIGKIGIPDAILLKPGKLTTAEFAVMKTHPTLGKEAIEHAERQMGRSVPFLAFAKEIAYGHQERWDGNGYPQGIAGDRIPIAARLMAVADVYDALISQRVYKPPMSHEQAVAIISEGRGTHFDPDIVDAFLAIHELFRKIASQFVDAQIATIEFNGRE